MLIIAINAQSHSASKKEHHKSAITDHVCQNNNTMNWEASEIVDQEVTSLRDNTPRMNTDEEAYHLLQYGHK